MCVRHWRQINGHRRLAHIVWLGTCIVAMMEVILGSVRVLLILLTGITIRPYLINRITALE